jgi:hypothetical protein
MSDTPSSPSLHASPTHEQPDNTDEKESPIDINADTTVPAQQGVDSDPDALILARREHDGVALVPTSIQCGCTFFTHYEYHLTDRVKSLTKAERHKHQTELQRKRSHKAVCLNNDHADRNRKRRAEAAKRHRERLRQKKSTAASSSTSSSSTTPNISDYDNDNNDEDDDDDDDDDDEKNDDQPISKRPRLQQLHMTVSNDEFDTSVDTTSSSSSSSSNTVSSQHTFSDMLYHFPLDVLCGNSARCWNEYGYFATASTIFDMPFITSWLDIHQQVITIEEATPKKKRVGEYIDGGATQYDLNSPNFASIPSIPDMRATTFKRVKEYFKSIGVDKDGESNYELKVISFPPHAKRQARHMDSLDGRFTSFIIPFSTMRGTELSRIPRCFRPRNNNNDTYIRNNTWCWDEQFIASKVVHAGNLIAFAQDTIHNAPANDTDRPRVFLFGSIGPPNSDPHINSQYYIWSYMRDVFGSKSSRFAACLVEHSRHIPLSFIADNPTTFTEYKEAIERHHKALIRLKLPAPTPSSDSDDAQQQ